MIALQQVYHRLFERFGPQHWWPGDSPLEVVVGAVLVQNTNWNNVKKAIANLREANLLDPQSLVEIPAEELEERIRPAGYFRVKARRLQNLMRFLVDRYGGSLEAMFQSPPDELRQALLSVNGVGPETADSILLYAGGMAVFVVDAYTYRVLTRHGWIDEEADYHLMQETFQSQLVSDAALYNEYHALLVRLGKEYCRKRPKCSGCPLQDMLPPGGPHGVGGDDESFC